MYEITEEERAEVIKKINQYCAGEELGITELAKMIKRRLRKDWDIYLSVEGLTGVGKSTFLIILGLLVDDKFNLKDNIAYIPEGDELKKQFWALKRYQFFGIDEAVRSLHKYKWHDKLQQTVIEMGNTERFQNKAVAMCMPNFSDFTSAFRKWRIDVRVWIYARGRAIVYVKHNDKDIDDPWHSTDNLKIKSKRWVWLQRKSRGVTSMREKEILEMERKTLNFAFEFKFPDLKDIAPAIATEYNRLKALSREEDVKKKEEETVETIGLRGMRHKLNRDKLITAALDSWGIPENKVAKALGVQVKVMKNMYLTYKRSNDTANMKENTSTEYSNTQTPPGLAVELSKALENHNAL